MIVSKPKSSALIALVIFIIICLAIGGYALRPIINGVGAWYHYFISSLFLLIGIVLLLRQMLSYKIIKFGDKAVAVSYPMRMKSVEFKLKDLDYWKEVIIKTKNDPFQQMEIKFTDFMLKLSVQENSNYDKIKKYLKKRVGKKEIK